MYVRTYVRTYVCMYVYVCMHACMHTCMYVCIYIYILCLVCTIYQKQQQTNQAFGCHSTTLATLRLGCFGAVAVQHDPHPNIGKRSDAVAVEHSPESFGCGIRSQ